jgi:tetratricopeptide (TPR) repeat protein
MSQTAFDRKKFRLEIFGKEIIVICGVAFSLLVSGETYSAEGDSGDFAVTREVSTQEAYINLLKENEAVKKEILEKDDVISRNAGQNRVLTGRIKDLEGRIQFLTRGMEATEKLLEEEKKKHMKTAEDLEKKVLEALGKAEETENRYNKQEYVVKYREVKKQLDDARKALNDMAKKKSDELVAAEKSIVDLSRKNEQLKTDIGKAHFNLGTLFFKTGNHEKSAYEYEQAIKVMPNDPETCYNLAILYDYYLDDPQKAKGYYQKYLRVEVDPRRKKQLKERVAENKLLAIMNSYKID